MRYWTYAEIKEKVENDLDLTQETFITPAELLGYCNAGIDEAEAEIHTLYEDYFLVRSTIDLVIGQQEYSLPSDIYANKIRGMVYNDGNDFYKVKRYTDLSKFLEVSLDEEAASEPYKYILTNDATDGLKIRLVPTALENLTSGIEFWYLRNAARMIDDTSECDIPEFTQFVIQYMKKRCYEKEGHPNLGQAVNDLEVQRKTMINTLTNMIPDGDTAIEQDMTFYWETV